MKIADDLRQAGTDIIKRTLDNYDAEEAIKVTRELNQALLDLQAEVALIRRECVRTLRLEGWGLREIGEAAGMSHQRVYQIEQGHDRKEKG